MRLVVLGKTYAIARLAPMRRASWSHLLGPLAHAGIAVFPVATYDTDYVLVKKESLEAAAVALRAHGHEVT